MTTKELLSIVKARGLTVFVKDGQPFVQAAKDKRTMVTDKLLLVLEKHRERIIEMLSSDQSSA